VPNVLWASNEISRKAKEARKNATKKSDVVHDFSRQPEELERKQRIDDLIKQADRANKPRARWQIFKRS
jgi:hypothetical protein